MARPFLKWVGGKRQLLPALSPLLPRELLAGRIKTYAEPFLGGGAMFFHLAEMGLGLRRAILRDANPELILAYRVVQGKVEALIEELQALEKKHLAKNESERREHFLKQREIFNADRLGFPYRGLGPAAVARAAQFVFLNRIGFNGLWRVNSTGAYNVPFGRYKQPRICDAKGLGQAAAALRALKAEIDTGDFAALGDIADVAGREAFIYYDPPYRPLTVSSAFTSYTAGGFDDAQQGRLAAFFAGISERGAKQMLSNSSETPTGGGPGFFQGLYPPPGAFIHKVKARRAINSRADSRGPIDEIVIVNYSA